MAKYAWIITEDLDAARTASLGLRPRAGIIGPSTVTPEQIERLEAGDGEVFTMGGDGEPADYRVRIIGTYDGGEPLTDFGTADTGCVWIAKGHGGQRDSIV